MDGTRFPSQIANRLGFSSPLCSTCITFITINAPHPACQTFSAPAKTAVHGIYPWLTMSYNGTVLLTHKHIGTQAVRFYFSFTGVKGLMEGLNKLCLCPCTWDHEYPRMHGLSSISASWSRSKLKNYKNTKPMGDHSHINNGTHRLPHILPLFNPPTSAQNPCFYQKIVIQSPFFFSHCSKFWKFFTQRPL